MSTILLTFFLLLFIVDVIFTTAALMLAVDVKTNELQDPDPARFRLLVSLVVIGVGNLAFILLTYHLLTT